jgi:hypothetical protein
VTLTVGPRLRSRQARHFASPHCGDRSWALGPSASKSTSKLYSVGDDLLVDNQRGGNDRAAQTAHPAHRLAVQINDLAAVYDPMASDVCHYDDGCHELRVGCHCTQRYASLTTGVADPLHALVIDARIDTPTSIGYSIPAARAWRRTSSGYDSWLNVAQGCTNGVPA